MSLLHAEGKVAAGALVIALAFTGTVHAHDPGLSTARLAVVGDSLRLS